jgi:hypothetical protein
MVKGMMEKEGSGKRNCNWCDEKIAVEMGVQKMHRGCRHNLYMLIEF